MFSIGHRGAAHIRSDTGDQAGDTNGAIVARQCIPLPVALAAADELAPPHIPALDARVRFSTCGLSSRIVLGNAGENDRCAAGEFSH